MLKYESCFVEIKNKKHTTTGQIMDILYAVECES